MIDPFVIVKEAITLAAAAVIYAWIVRRLADIAQPFRLELAATGERILAESESETRRTRVRFYLDNAFNGWASVLIVVLTPVVTVWLIARSIVAVCRGKFPSAARPGAEDMRMALLFIVSAFASNPLFGLVMALEFLLCGLAIALIGGIPSVFAAFDAVLRAETFIPSYRNALLAFQR